MPLPIGPEEQIDQVGFEPTFDTGYKPAASTVGLLVDSGQPGIRTPNFLRVKEALSH